MLTKLTRRFDLVAVVLENRDYYKNCLKYADDWENETEFRYDISLIGCVDNSYE